MSEQGVSSLGGEVSLGQTPCVYTQTVCQRLQGGVKISPPSTRDYPFGEDSSLPAHIYSTAMGKVRLFCRSGLESNILRPYCGLLSTKFGYHGLHLKLLMLLPVICQGWIKITSDKNKVSVSTWAQAVILFDCSSSLNLRTGDGRILWGRWFQSSLRPS